MSERSSRRAQRTRYSERLFTKERRLDGLSTLFVVDVEMKTIFSRIEASAAGVLLLSSVDHKPTAEQFKVKNKLFQSGSFTNDICNAARAI